MARFSTSLELPAPLGEVFSFCLVPANRLRLSPPHLHLEMVDAPPTLCMGARLAWKVRRWGVSQRLVTEIVAIEPEKVIVEEQRQGPFGRWTHRQQFTAHGEGTRWRDDIEFEPPGGLLGRLVTTAAVLKDLQAAFAFRDEKLRERFAKAVE